MCISPPVSAFTVKTKADVLAHFRWLCAREGMEAFPYWNGHYPSILIASLILATPVSLRRLCPGSCWWSQTPVWLSDPTQEVCSRNGTRISCVLTTRPSASSLKCFKNNSLLQSFPPHNICSKCSPFLMYLIPCSVANDHSRALLTPYKAAFNCFGFCSLFTAACYPFLLPSPVYKCVDFHVT